jgi:hypothetical protein
MIVFTDAPDSHHTIDRFKESSVSNISTQLDDANVRITTLEDRIRKMEHTVHVPVPPIQITLPRLTPLSDT